MKINTAISVFYDNVGHVVSVLEMGTCIGYIYILDYNIANVAL